MCPVMREHRKRKLTVLVVREDFSEKVTCELTRYQDVGVFQGGKSLRGAFKGDGIACALTWEQGGTQTTQELDGKECILKC